jgi:hypothetical protein
VGYVGIAHRALAGKGIFVPSYAPVEGHEATSATFYATALANTAFFALFGTLAGYVLPNLGASIPSLYSWAVLPAILAIVPPAFAVAAFGKGYF